MMQTGKASVNIAALAEPGAIAKPSPMTTVKGESGRAAMQPLTSRPTMVPNWLNPKIQLAADSHSPSPSTR